MVKFIAPLAVLLMMSGGPRPETKVPCYAWLGGPDKATDAQLAAKFADLRKKGIDGILYSAGHDPEIYRRVGKAVNGLGQSAFDKPAYVDHYKFLCPNREEVFLFLADLYGRVAEVPEVDGIHLDFIRFPDVILARGLWKKYGLVMDREYPQFDYCYCDKCVADFKEKSGIDIKAIKDPSTVEAWKQFRYDLITNLVDRLAKEVRSKRKRITAAVFPGPDSVAKKIVRQEWDKWDLDAFFPMNYNDFYLEGTKWIGAMCKEGVTALGGRKPLYSGLFICPDPAGKASEPDPENHGLVPEEIEAAVRESMENGAAGICLFTPDRMTAEDWVVFEKAIHAGQRR
jgi:hypothetical protein